MNIYIYTVAKGYKVDVDESLDMAQLYEVAPMPTVLLTEDGKVFDKPTRGAIPHHLHTNITTLR